MAEYLFAYAKEKAKRDGYSSLAAHEKWDWHGDIYGFRRVALGISRDENTSPCDPKGDWFDDSRANLAEAYYRNKLHGGTQRRRAKQMEEDAAGGRAIEEKWARDRGYESFDQYKDIERIDHSEACRRVVESITKSAILKNRDVLKGPDHESDRQTELEKLGVKAREYNPSAAELRAGRIALGLERDTEAEAAE